MVVSLWAYSLRAVVVRAEPAAADRASQRREGDGRQKRDEVRLIITEAQCLPGPRDLFEPSRLPLLVEEATNHMSGHEQQAGGRNTQQRELCSTDPPLAPSHGEENPIGHVHDPPCPGSLLVSSESLY